MIAGYKIHYRVLLCRGVHARINNGTFITFVEQNIGIFLVGIIFKGLDVGHKPKIQI